MTEEQEKQKGHIDLVKLFQADVVELQSAITRGRLLHRTMNIRDSGAPFESAFRSLWAARLPKQFTALHGYLFDVQSNCTPQIDAMIANAEEHHELISTEEGAAYVPFTSALAIFELKNSAQNIAKHLDQLAATTAAVEKMTRKIRQQRLSGGPVLHIPASVLIFGDSEKATLEDVKKWYSENGGKAPHYVLFLDKGVLIARGAPLFHELAGTKDDQSLPFYFQGGAPHQVFVAKAFDALAPGRALLWLYFALLAYFNFTKGNQSNVLAFTNDVQRTHPMHPIMDLDQLTNWASLEQTAHRILD